MVSSITLTIDADDFPGGDRTLTFVDNDTRIGMSSVSFGEEMLIESLQVKNCSPTTTVTIVPDSDSRYSVGIGEISLQQINPAESALSIEATMVKGKQVFLKIEESGVFPVIDSVDLLIHNDSGVYLRTEGIDLRGVDRDKIPVFLYDGFRYIVKRIIHTPYPYGSKNASLVHQDINGSVVREGQTIRCGPTDFRYFEVLYDVPRELQGLSPNPDVWLEWQMQKGKWQAIGIRDGYKMPLPNGFGKVKVSDFRRVSLDYVTRQKGYILSKYTVKVSDDVITMKVFIKEAPFRKITVNFEGLLESVDVPSMMKWKIISGDKEPAYKGANLWEGRSGGAYQLHAWEPYYVLKKKKVMLGDVDQQFHVQMKKSDAVRISLYKDGIDVGEFYRTRLFALDSWVGDYLLREKRHGDIIAPNK